MTDVTIDSVKLYANELIDHLREYCYLFDIAAGVFLWRGSFCLTLFGLHLSCWFPLDSMVLFLSVLLALEFPIYFPSIALYLISYMLLKTNYHLSSNPSPWLRIRSARQIAMTHYGISPPAKEILPGTGEEEARAIAKIEEYRYAYNCISIPFHRCIFQCRVVYLTTSFSLHSGAMGTLITLCATSSSAPVPG